MAPSRSATTAILSMCMMAIIEATIAVMMIIVIEMPPGLAAEAVPTSCQANGLCFGQRGIIHHGLLLTADSTHFPRLL